MCDDKLYLTLRCVDCDYIECPMAHRYVSSQSKEGCIKEVSEEENSRFYHYVYEVIPFWKTSNLNNYKEVIDFLYQIYSKPTTQRLDPEGKVRLRGY